MCAQGLGSSNQHCSSTIPIPLLNCACQSRDRSPEPGRCCWLLYGMLGMNRMSCQRSKGSGLGELGARAVSGNRILFSFCCPEPSDWNLGAGWALEGAKRRRVHNSLCDLSQ